MALEALDKQMESIRTRLRLIRIGQYDSRAWFNLSKELNKLAADERMIRNG